MISNWNKLNSLTVRIHQQPITLKTLLTQFPYSHTQAYFQTDHSQVVKVYDLSEPFSRFKYDNQVFNLEEKRLLALPAYMGTTQCTVGERKFGLIVLEGLNVGAILACKMEGLQEIQVAQIALSMIGWVKELRDGDLVVGSLHPSHIYLTPQNKPLLLNTEFLASSRSRSQLSHIFDEGEKDWKFGAPQVVNVFSEDSLNYCADLFSWGCILWRLRFHTDAFQSKNKLTALERNKQKHPSWVDMLVRKVLVRKQHREKVQLEELERELKEIVYGLSKQIMFQKSANSVFSQYLHSYLSAQDGQSKLMVAYVHDSESNVRQSLKCIEEQLSNKTHQIKLLLLLLQLLQKGPKSMIESMEPLLPFLKGIQGVGGITSLIKWKIQLHSQTNSLFHPNFYLSVEQYSTLNVNHVKYLSIYLNTLVKFLLRVIMLETTTYSHTFISMITHEIYGVICMAIFCVVSLKQDVKLQLRKEKELDGLGYVEKVIQAELKKLSTFMSQVPACRLSTISLEYSTYKNAPLPHKPVSNYLAYMYEYIGEYHGLCAPVDTNRTAVSKHSKRYSEGKGKEQSTGCSLVDDFGLHGLQKPSKKQKNTFNKRSSYSFEELSQVFEQKPIRQATEHHEEQDFPSLSAPISPTKPSLSPLLDFDVLRKQITKTPRFDTKNPFTKNIIPKQNPYHNILTNIQQPELKKLLSDKVLLKFDDIEIGRQIGEGGAGEVFRGRYLKKDVAIKKIKNKPQIIKQFERELITFIKLKNNNHVVKFIGICYEKGTYYLLTELCEGSLFTLLHQRKNSVMIPMQDKLKMLLEIAEAMESLHGLQILHRDLKSLNVLVRRNGRKWEMKLTDFGLARTPAPEIMTTQLGTIHWMAPEILESKTYSWAVDVYSYGILMWEVLTETVPYAELSHPMSILKHVAVEGKRPKLSALPSNTPVGLPRLMEQCWQQNPHHRPSFSRIITKLNSLH